MLKTDAPFQALKQAYDLGLWAFAGSGHLPLIRGAGMLIQVLFGAGSLQEAGALLLAALAPWLASILDLSSLIVRHPVHFNKVRTQIDNPQFRKRIDRRCAITGKCTSAWTHRSRALTHIALLSFTDNTIAAAC